MTIDDHASRRATQIFSIEEDRLDSPIAERIWRARSEPSDSFTSVAATHWEMVVTRHENQTALTVRGPETRATTVAIPQDAEFFGIQFRLGTALTSLPVEQLVDDAVTLAAASARSFWLNGSAWEYPSVGNVDVFLKRLVRQGLIFRDRIVEVALQGQATGLSVRSVQRRIRRTTGMTHAVITQIERAHLALSLLDAGVAIADVVERAGYADQPHLTRALRRFIGHTPGRIVRDNDK